MMDDPDQMYANFRAFNRWLEEEWGYGTDGRIFSPPLLSLLDVDRAVEELDRVLAAGRQDRRHRRRARSATTRRPPTPSSTRSGRA